VSAELLTLTLLLALGLVFTIILSIIQVNVIKILVFESYRVL